MILTMFCLLAALQVADVATTYHIISKDLGSEANPIMVWLIARLGLTLGLIVPKVAALALIYLFVYGDYAPYVFSALIALYALVIFNNVKIIQKSR